MKKFFKATKNRSHEVPQSTRPLGSLALVAFYRQLICNSFSTVVAYADKSCYMKSCIYQCFLTASCAIAFLFSSMGEARAQFDSLGINTEWRSGSIVLMNNSLLKGVIQFNDKLGIIKFRKSPDADEESFSETSIQAMQFYDEDAACWRNFATFKVREEQTGWRGAMLFEVLMEFKTFALLSRVERVNVGVRQRQDALGGYYHVKVGYEQFERLCLVNEDGRATIILEVSEFERKKLSMASKLKPYLDKGALEKYLADDWDKFQVLVKSNKLNLKKRADFIRAFECFREAKHDGS